MYRLLPNKVVVNSNCKSPGCNGKAKVVGTGPSKQCYCYTFDVEHCQIRIVYDPKMTKQSGLSKATNILKTSTTFFGMFTMFEVRR